MMDQEKVIQVGTLKKYHQIASQGISNNLAQKADKNGDRTEDFNANNIHAQTLSLSGANAGVSGPLSTLDMRDNPTAYIKSKLEIKNKQDHGEVTIDVDEQQISDGIDNKLTINNTAWGKVYLPFPGSSQTDTIATLRDLEPLATEEDLPTALSQLTDDRTHRLVTDAEKTAWNAKQDKMVNEHQGAMLRVVELVSGPAVRMYTDNGTLVSAVCSTGSTGDGRAGDNGLVTEGFVRTKYQRQESGKGLSANDYTTAEKEKLAGVADGAEVNVQADWSVTDATSDAYIKNKPTIPTVPTKVSAFQNDAGYLKTLAMEVVSTDVETDTTTTLQPQKVYEFYAASQGKVIGMTHALTLNLEFDVSDRYTSQLFTVFVLLGSGGSVTIGSVTGNTPVIYPEDYELKEGVWNEISAVLVNGKVMLRSVAYES